MVLVYLTHIGKQGFF